MSMSSNPESSNRPARPELRSVRAETPDLLDPAHIPDRVIVELVLRLLVEAVDDEPVTAETIRARLKQYIPDSLARDEIMARALAGEELSKKELLQVRAATIASAQPEHPYEVTTAMQHSPQVRYIETTLAGLHHIGSQPARELQHAFSRLEQLYIGAGLKASDGQTEALNQQVVRLLLRPAAT